MAILITDVDLISTDALGGQGNRESLICKNSQGCLQRG